MHAYVRVQTFTTKHRSLKVVSQRVRIFKYLTWEFVWIVFPWEFTDVILHGITRLKRGLVVKKKLVLLLTHKAHYAIASLSRLLLTGEQVFCWIIISSAIGHIDLLINAALVRSFWKVCKSLDSGQWIKLSSCSSKQPACIYYDEEPIENAV